MSKRMPNFTYDEEFGKWHDSVGLTEAFYSNKALQVSDEIFINYDDAISLKKLWVGTDEDIPRYIPSDLVLTNHIPIPNIKVIVDDRGYLDGGIKYQFDVCIVPKSLVDRSIQALKEHSSSVDMPNLSIACGLLYLRYAKNNIIASLGLKGDCIGVSTDLIVNGIRLYDDPVFHQKFPQYQALVADCLDIWYGLQIALQHPQIKDVFNTASSSVDVAKGNTSPSKKRKTQYIKKHYKNGKISKIIEAHRHRKTLCWYVIGHWRNYKNGRFIFINGYWKGPLREAKRNLDEGRERIIAV